MTKSKLILTEQSWKELNSESRDWIIYNNIIDLDTRIEKIEGRCLKCYNGKLFTKSIAFAGGCFGGVLGFFSSKFFNGGS